MTGIIKVHAVKHSQPLNKQTINFYNYSYASQLR